MGITNYVTKRIIYQSFCELLKEKPITRITVKEILDKSKCSRSTFYRHFRDKFDLMNWFYQYHVEQIFLSGKSFYEIQLNILKFYNNNRSYFEKIIRYEGQNSFRNFVHYKGEELVKNIVKKKLNTDKLSIELEFAIKMYNYGAFNMAIEWLSKNSKMTPEEFNRLRCLNMPEILKKILIDPEELM